MYEPISLDRDEQLLCLFLRGEGQAFDELAPRDFERRLHLNPPEGGISFFRAKTTDYREMVERVCRNPSLNRGIAIVSVGQILDLDFHLYADLDENDQHVCIHCLTCNGQKDDCSPKAMSCTFVSPEAPNAENDRSRRQLADAIAIVLESRNSRTELLEIFGTDLTGTVGERNAAYAHRWEVAQSILLTHLGDE